VLPSARIASDFDRPIRTTLEANEAAPSVAVELVERLPMGKMAPSFEALTDQGALSLCAYLPARIGRVAEDEHARRAQRNFEPWGLGRNLVDQAISGGFAGAPIPPEEREVMRNEAGFRLRRSG
jgi:hypothetical protein